MQSPSKLIFEWIRKGNSQKSKEIDIEPHQRSVKIDNENLAYKNTGFNYDTVHDTWLPDINELILYCNKEMVGTVKFDLANFVDKPKQK